MNKEEATLPCGLKITVICDPTRKSTDIIWNPRPPYDKSTLKEINELADPWMKKFISKNT